MASFLDIDWFCLKTGLFTIIKENFIYNLGPAVQSIVSLTSLLVVKMLTVLVSTVSYTQVFLLKNVRSYFFNKNFSLSVIFNDQSYNSTLTYDIVSLDHLGQKLIRTLLNIQRGGTLTAILKSLNTIQFLSLYLVLIKLTPKCMICLNPLALTHCYPTLLLPLTPATLWVGSTDDHLVIIYLFFLAK